MRVQARIILGSLAIALIASVVLVLFHINGPRVVGRAAAPDGTEMCLVQKCNWNGEPFTTSFVYRRPGGTWNWFYYDHQDSYWGRSRVELDTNAGVVVFYRGQYPAVTFEWATKTYKMRHGNRTTIGGDPLPAGWNPKRAFP